jgi:hypothetical protein
VIPVPVLAQRGSASGADLPKLPLINQSGVHDDHRRNSAAEADSHPALKHADPLAGSVTLILESPGLSWGLHFFPGWQKLLEAGANSLIWACPSRPYCPDPRKKRGREGCSSDFCHPGFFRPTRGPAGANDGGIDEPQRVAQATLVFPFFQQLRQDLRPRAVTSPAPEPALHASPGTVAFRDVAPGGAGVESPEDAVDNAAVILRWPTATAVMPRLGQERLETFPLLVRQFIAVSHGWPPGRTTISPTDLRLLWKKGILQTVPSVVVLAEVPLPKNTRKYRKLD